MPSPKRKTNDANSKKRLLKKSRAFFYIFSLLIFGFVIYYFSEPVIILSFVFLAIIHTVSFIRSHFGMTTLSIKQLAVCLMAALISVGWFEIYKAGLSPVSIKKATDHKHRF